MTKTTGRYVASEISSVTRAVETLSLNPPDMSR
jgi:hypothetical protein